VCVYACGCGGGRGTVWKSALVHVHVGKVMVDEDDGMGSLVNATYT
jgi:hypothetical protein